MLYVLKVVVSALMIIGVTELAKRGGTFWGGVLASLPLTSLLAFVWLYVETRDADCIAALSFSIFWMVLPSLSLFIALPLLLKHGLIFPLALAASVLMMAIAYLATAIVLKKFGVDI